MNMCGGTETKNNSFCLMMPTWNNILPYTPGVLCMPEVGWSCMLLRHPFLTCADACADLCTLHPDLCTLCLQWLSLAAIYGGGVSPLDVGTTTPLAPAVVSPITSMVSPGSGAGSKVARPQPQVSVSSNSYTEEFEG